MIEKNYFLLIIFFPIIISTSPLTKKVKHDAKHLELKIQKILQDIVSIMPNKAYTLEQPIENLPQLSDNIDLESTLKEFIKTIESSTQQLQILYNQHQLNEKIFQTHQSNINQLILFAQWVDAIKSIHQWNDYIPFHKSISNLIQSHISILIMYPALEDLLIIIGQTILNKLIICLLITHYSQEYQKYKPILIEFYQCYRTIFNSIPLRDYSIDSLL